MSREPVHVSSLDGLRFFAFLSVFLLHGLQHDPRFSDLPFVKHGWMGVSVFFVLSGFLIGRILIGIRDRQVMGLGQALKIFYIRRSLRIVPLYYVALVLLFVLPWPWPRPWSYLVANSLYLSDLLPCWIGGWPDGTFHLWSLSVEEHFYLLAPLAVLMLRPRHLEATLLGVCAVSAALRCYHHLHFISPFIGVFSPFQFDFMAVGMMAAIVQEKGRFAGLSMPALRAIGLVGVAAFLVPMNVDLGQTRALRLLTMVTGQSCAAVTWAALVMGVWNRAWWPLEWLLSRRPLVFLGKISYGLYVFHGPYIQLMETLFAREKVLPLWSVGLAFVATIASAVASWYLLENPINECKRYFPYARREVEKLEPRFLAVQTPT